MNPEEKLLHSTAEKREEAQAQQSEGLGMYVKAFAAFFGIIVLGVLFSKGNQTAPAASQVLPSARVRSAAENLAIIETSDGNPSPALVAQFDSALKRLTAKFPEADSRIADMTVRAQDLLREHGISEGLFTIMTAIDAATSGGTLGISYAEATAAYVTIRSKGR